jgi:cytoskeleton protein RodZ
MSDFGGKLRLARERRGVSLRQIATSTKISAGALEALERNDISKLPGGIFSRAFVRSYAVEVGLDPDETVKEFLARFQGETTHPTTAPSPIPASEASFDTRQRIAGLVLKLLVFGIPLIAIVLYFTLRARSAHSAPVPPPVAVEQAAGSPAPTSPEVPAAPLTVPTDRANVPLAGVGTMTLEMHPTSECWVKLTVDGRPVLARTMRGGEKEVRTVQDRMVIEVGDAGAFAFSVDGRAGKPLGIAGQVRTANITRDTLSQFLQ